MAQQWDPIVVIWKDAFSSDRHCSREFVKHKIEPCTRRSIGFLIHEDTENIVVAGEDDRESMETLDSTDDCDGVTVIPRGMVSKVIELTERRGGRRETNEPDS